MVNHKWIKLGITRQWMRRVGIQYSLHLIVITLTFTMASGGPVKWSRADEATLVRTLAEEKAKGNWVDNKPKAAAWAACELALVDSEKKSGGSAKTIESIKSRWQRVRPSQTTQLYASLTRLFSLNRNSIPSRNFERSPVLDGTTKKSLSQRRLTYGTHTSR